jgi:hypothetical protein
MASPALASRGAILGGVRGNNTTILSRGLKVPTPLRSRGCIVRVSAEGAAAVAPAEAAAPATGYGNGKRVVFVGGTGRVGSSSAAALLRTDPSVHIILAAGPKYTHPETTPGPPNRGTQHGRPPSWAPPISGAVAISLTWVQAAREEPFQRGADCSGSDRDFSSIRARRGVQLAAGRLVATLRSRTRPVGCGECARELSETGDALNSNRDAVLSALTYGAHEGVVRIGEGAPPNPAGAEE